MLDIWIEKKIMWSADQSQINILTNKIKFLFFLRWRRDEQFLFSKFELCSTKWIDRNRICRVYVGLGGEVFIGSIDKKYK